MITDKGAIDLAAGYLFSDLLNSLRVFDGPPPGTHPYLAVDPEKCWFVSVPNERPILGASRYIIISKETGKIVGDQRLGE